MEALWPGEDPKRSRHRLYQAARDARRLLGDGVASERDRYWLDHDRVRVDIDELEVLLGEVSRADGHRRLELLEKALGSAHVMYGELALCWQHENTVVYHLSGDERSVPVGMSETRFAYGATDELQTWLSARRIREAREAKEASDAAAEQARREEKAEMRRAAARAARRARTRAKRPNPSAACGNAR